MDTPSRQVLRVEVALRFGAPHLARIKDRVPHQRERPVRVIQRSPRSEKDCVFDADKMRALPDFEELDAPALRSVIEVGRTTSETPVPDRGFLRQRLGRDEKTLTRAR